MKRLLVYVLLVGVVGCGSAPFLEQSEFFKAGSQWMHSETAFSSTDELVFNGRRANTTEGESPEESHFTSLLTITVSSTSDGINKFMRGLRANLEVFAQQTGTIHSQDPGDVNDQLREFSMKYTAGNARGTVEAVLEAEDNQSDQGDIETYRLTLTIDELVD
tara:strand:+ start:1349 stop:1834 length:486 start_codon:yes stop_codon:yes gene_type:complete